ncbi:hypothetical protein ALC60_08851 [Trachymyrmex zeteki]|uniref:Uncharacterized protein n=1 Tax=Mycetomoellerius zeteki TaxID=64791 RepID=A0A151WWP3_9HYME|nr:hypothetical protein ALC60_08851 [Trachymyrmex zeteki]
MGCVRGGGGWTDGRATDAVGMRVQSVAKIDGFTKRGSSGIRKRFQEDKCRTINTFS